MKLRTEVLDARAAERLSVIHQACFDQSWSVEEFARLLQNPAIDGLALCEDRRDVGMALVQTIAGETEILTFGIVNGRRAKGLGYRLLRAVSDLSRVKAAKAIFLEVSSANIAARNLYSGFGFEQTAVRKAYYSDRSDALVCRLSLTY